ncbi:MAG: hypothetical protein WAW17_21985 [Rhodococcus sp. (in: high G+C Gram-positive bacteria)]|uniref:hypothetical protein n=1 Tax=Rhodococcus sp. TaxID=1831 RepID=UPI003BB05F3E
MSESRPLDTAAPIEGVDGDAHDTELAVSLDEEGLLVSGDPVVVARYLARIKSLAGEAIEVSGITSSSAADAGAIAAGVLSTAAQAGEFVRMSPKSIQALRTHRVLPGDNGFFRMTVVDEAGKFRNQLQWQKIALGPTQALSLQLLAVQIALSTSIASVEESVLRVEGKVERVLALAEASRVGDVIGHFATLERLVKNLDDRGALPTTDWESVAGLGPTLVVTVERLREHIKRTVAGFDPTLPVRSRADYLRRAVEDNRIGESLHLLVISEQSLYLWQRLRIARVRAIEPEHLQMVLADARELLAEHLERDGEILVHARSELSHYAEMHRLDGIYWGATHNLKHDIVKLKNDLDSFADARGSQVMGWVDPGSRPTVGDAVAEIGSRAATVGGAAAGAAGRAIAAGASGVGNGIGRLGRGLGNLVGGNHRQPELATTAEPTSDTAAPAKADDVAQS